VIFAASFALFAPQPTGWLSFAVVAAVVGLRLGGVFLQLVDDRGAADRDRGDQKRACTGLPNGRTIVTGRWLFGRKEL